MRLKDFSEALGLSPTTVSRALNGYPEVNAATRARVVAAAEKFGYAPNLQAQRLASGKSMSIGHVIPLTQNKTLNPILVEFLAGAGETCARRGYDMLTSVAPDDGELDAYRELASRRKVDGLILHSPLIEDPRPAALAELETPFIVHGRSKVSDTQYSWIDIENRRAFERAAELLIDLGHERIALLNGPQNAAFANDRWRGFRAACRSRGTAPDEALIRFAEMTEPYGYDAASELLSSAKPPTAFLVSSVITASGVARAVGERGMKLGRDVSVISHDDVVSFQPNGGDVPLYTCTRSSVRAAGRRAAEMLIDMIVGARDAPVHELWEPELVLGRSTSRPPR